MSSDEIRVSFPENCTEEDKTRLPVIFLFGWAGASVEKLSQYQKFYNENGYITVAYTAPWNFIFVNNEKIPAKAEKLVEFVKEAPFARNPSAFHVFSNLGCAVYQHYTRILLSEKESSHQFKGIIFDSCPGKRKIRSFFNAMEFVVGGNIFRRKMVPFFYFVYLIGKKIFRSLAGQTDPEIWWDYIEKSDPLKMPQLYICSKADICVDPEDSMEMARIKSEAGVDTTLETFMASQHVSHLDKYPEEYKKCCLDFTGKVFGAAS